MKAVLVTVLCCVWVVFFVVAGIYTFNTPRTWVLRLLGTQEAAAITASSSAILPNQNNTTAGTFAIGTTTAFPPLQSVPPANTTGTANNTYQYKLLSGVAPCTLNQLGAGGWHVVQIGGTLVPAYGGDADCKKFGITDSLDWALFENQN